MYTFMFLVCIVIGIITTYKLKDTIIEDIGTDFLPLSFIYIAHNGYQKYGDIDIFIISLLTYIVLLIVVSLLWFIAIPLLILYLIIKKFLKKKS